MDKLIKSKVGSRKEEASLILVKDAESVKTKARSSQPTRGQCTLLEWNVVVCSPCNLFTCSFLIHTSIMSAKVFSESLSSHCQQTRTPRYARLISVSEVSLSSVKFWNDRIPKAFHKLITNLTNAMNYRPCCYHGTINKNRTLLDPKYIFQYHTVSEGVRIWIQIICAQCLCPQPSPLCLFSVCQLNSQDFVK